ncbi:TetR family transcriptional regulator [Mycolicibacterium sp. CBMA 226]|uniref:TetR family transcriptional regulator n=1 Tax=Mycolicibacterium sp. CBMA 226 TaxID=2606611 RepID=UPI0012DE3C32|nr:TetR family transcriptional regulator [Mycolicibacterium sp. CBMA 226]MUL77016.1 TetR family transcriptional regulator [Mycolicibacterium sp. CBMA 226]
MPRWEDGSKERLQLAAMELFEEQGFEQTSAVQIAKRARLTTRTFFRYFPDKQEVLFADEEMLRNALVQAIRRAVDLNEPLQAVTRILAGFNWESLASRESQRRREAMIASNLYLLERDLIKQQQMADALSNALCERGVDADVAGLSAQVGIQVFRIAYRQWLVATDPADLAVMTETALALLATLVPASVPTSQQAAQVLQSRR